MENWYRDYKNLVESTVEAPSYGARLQQAVMNAESAMFHVLADGGFNGPADLAAMQEAHAALRALMAEPEYKMLGVQG
jgi:hypothetical protein